MSLPLIRLMQLVSPALPVGAYTYSQGLEWVVDTGAVKTEAQVGEWIGDALGGAFGCYELPLLARLMAAWQQGDDAAVVELNAHCLASRETAELRAETVQMGYSLRRLLHDLDDFPVPPALDALPEVAFPTGWALAAAVWEIPLADSLAAYLWSWCENQVMAALKAIPLGQTAGQRALLALGGRIPVVVQLALSLPEAEWSNFAPGLALASSRHETQYSRLFRS